MQTRIYLLLLLCISTTYLFAQNTTIKPDKACINCQTDTLELGTVLRVKGNTKLEGTINIIAAQGDSSLFIGANAGGKDNRTNNQNTFVGTNAGANSTSGNRNTFLGKEAGFNNRSIKNTFVGQKTGFSNTIGFDNTFVGQEAGYHNTDGFCNTFVGQNAGASNSIGSDNTFVGQNAGYNHTRGSDNTFVGQNAGYHNTRGTENTFVGQEAGFSNTLGKLNTFIGQETGKNNTTGESNTFVGRSAGQQNISANENTFVGYIAGSNNTTGDRNTFLGSSAGFFNATGAENTFLGTNAGFFNTNGAKNTFLGRGAGASNTEGSDNTFIGRETGALNTTGSENTFIGFEAGLRSKNDTRNTFIGYRADQLKESKMLDRAISIGYNAKVDCSHCAVIGGTGIDTVRVGIGVSAPTERLEVDGNVKAVKFLGDGSMLTNIDVKDADSDARNEIQDLALNGNVLSLTNDNTTVDLSNFQNNWAENNGNTYRNSGNVGIGTADPTKKLDVNGRVRIRDLPAGFGTSIVVDSKGNLFKSKYSSNIAKEKINNLQEENAALKSNIKSLEARLAKIETLLSGKVEVNNTTSTITSASLQQNAPNPFSEATTINYFIPETVKSASLQVMDQNGRIIKRIPIQDTGNGQITLQANLLSAGTYSYSLVLDGQVMDTKQMVLTH